jgi:ribosomal RNA assembly protein
LPFVRIPKDRVGILIGSEGKVKQYIEEKLQVKLQVESEGSITIELSREASDPSLLFKAKDVVTAIGRGFSPRARVSPN